MKDLIRKSFRRLNSYLLFIKGDPFTRAVRRWFKDRGDETLRLDYPLSDKSVVFDIGGYKGEWASGIQNKFGCRVFVFEPMPKFADALKKQFSENTKIKVLDFGLGMDDAEFELSDAADGSSAFRVNQSTQTVLAKCRKFDPALLNSFGVEHIDLIKINIEGAEYDLLTHIIDSGLIDHINYLQIQFHDFVPDAARRRLGIRKALSHTHRENWCYEFVWESWQKLV